MRYNDTSTPLPYNPNDTGTIDIGTFLSTFIVDKTQAISTLYVHRYRVDEVFSNIKETFKVAKNWRWFDRFRTGYQYEKTLKELKQSKKRLRLLKMISIVEVHREKRKQYQYRLRYQ